MNNLHARSPKEYQVKALCGLFGVSKQAYYKHDDDKAMLYMAQEEFVVQYIREVRVLDPGIGGRKLWEMYRREFQGNNPVGRDRFMDIVDRYGLKVRQRIRTPRTTDSTHNLPVYPNLVKGYIPMAPNRLVVSDITYIVIWVDEYTYEYYLGSGAYNAVSGSDSGDYTDFSRYADTLRIHTVPLKPGADYICDIDCYTSAATTDRGITVGSAREDVFKAYGDHYVDEGDGFYRYYDGEALPDTPSLMFYMPGGKVVFFSVSAAINF